jgi:hypothetical protein
MEAKRPPPIATDRANQVLMRLSEAEAGRWQAWWGLTLYLMLTSKSRGFGNETEYFITSMPGWIAAEEAVRQRIVGSAERYLAEAESIVDAWLGHNPMPIYRNDVAGLRAFILLKQRSPEGYARITDETWRKWAAVIVGLSRGDVVDNSTEIAQILTDALGRATAEFVAALRTLDLKLPA